jgi:hypothetical protein
MLVSQPQGRKAVLHPMQGDRSWHDASVQTPLARSEWGPSACGPEGK